MPSALAFSIAATAARSSTGPQSPPNCQVPYASGVTARPVRPSVTVRISFSFQKNDGLLSCL